ncbi:MAG: TonB family protein [Candidatus Babeliales bacterium]
MEARREEQEKFLMFLLSISLHLGIGLALILLTMQQKQALLPEQKTLEEIQKNDIIPPSNLAALKPRASVFGAPIIFQEEPEISQTSYDYDSTDNESYPIHKQNDKENDEDKNISQQSMEQASSQDIQTSNNTEGISIKNLHSKQIEAQETSVTQIQQEKQSKHDIANSMIKKRSMTPKKLPRSIPAQNQQTAGPTTRKLTFADLADGFLKSIKNEGDDWLERKGDENKKPDFKDLKYLSYIQKLVWYMQNEWRLQQSKLNIPPGQDLILTILIIIAKDGSVQDVRTLKPSGYQAYDSLLIKGVETAAPYPPVPNHFKSNNFDFVLTIHHQEEMAPRVNLRRSPSLRAHR